MFGRDIFVLARDTDWYFEMSCFRDARFVVRFAKDTDWYLESRMRPRIIFWIAILLTFPTFALRRNVWEPWGASWGPRVSTGEAIYQS